MAAENGTDTARANALLTATAKADFDLAVAVPKAFRSCRIRAVSAFNPRDPRPRLLPLPLPFRAKGTSSAVER
jgi:hypothetical protein